jgi:uncharacterized protein (TIGR00661 family)
MKIIYGISGEGNGHVMRSKEIIDHLKEQGHDVQIFTYGKGYDYIKHFYKTHKIAGFRIFYWNNKALGLGTGIINLLKLPFMILHNLKYLNTFLKFKPDIVISDFEPFTNYLTYFLGKKLISLENETLLKYTKTKEINDSFLNKFGAKLVVTLFTPQANEYVCPIFYKPDLKNKKNNFTITSSIIRKEIQSFKNKTKTNNHIFIYQTSDTNKAMFKTLKETDEIYIIYGFNKEKKEKNLHYKIFNDKNFYKDLAEAKAVITNGGLLLMTEALFLNKPVYSIPVNNQFEQIINAHYLKKLNLGEYTKKFNKNTLKNFLNNLNTYAKNTKSLTFDKNKKLFKHLQESMNRLTR